MADKENVAPATSSDPLQRLKGLSPSPKKAGRKGRSKSIGPGALEEQEAPVKMSAKDRRKSAFVPATKSILSKDEESARAARRKSMANRRVSFAPEATLHTWDIIMDHQEHTTSTDSDSATRRASQFSSAPDSDVDVAQDEEDRQLLESEDENSSKKSRRSSGIPPMNFNNPEDIYSSGMSGSEESGSENGEEDDSEDDEGTAMSLDVDDATIQSRADSDGSTGSSERLEASLRAAATLAGTRGIEYDEFGDMSMEVAEEEVTNAMQPWELENGLERIGSATLDQENVNPFSPVFKEVIAAQQIADDNDETQDMSMDVTRAVGGIMHPPRNSEPQSSPGSQGDGTMDFTQAVGRITGQKRRRSTTESGSPGAAVMPAPTKRRRSSVARTSLGDGTMDLTMAIGSIKSTTIPDRRRSLRGRRSSGIVSDTSDATMDMTLAVGGIRAAEPEAADMSFAGDEELSMELTTVIGGIRGDARRSPRADSRPITPQPSLSPLPPVNITPKDQERYKNTPDLGAKQLLAPILESAKKGSSPIAPRKSLSPMRLSQSPSQHKNRPSVTEQASSPERSAPSLCGVQEVSYPELPPLAKAPSPVRTPTSSPKRRQSRRNVGSEQRQFDAQLQAADQSPTIEKQVRSTVATPERSTVTHDDSRSLLDTLKLMTTPRKETLKHTTPKKTPAKQLSPVKTSTPRGRPTPKGSVIILPSPVRHLHEDLERSRESGQPQQQIGLQDFLAKAGIRFMDLTTTKRRLTVAPPSKTKSFSEIETQEIGLEEATVAAACTIPELEMYQHACHELKRFTKEGKQVIVELEEQTLQEQPPLIQAYAYVTAERKLVLDAQMRDMKTNARLRSKEMWYAWRSQLLDELVGGLSKIGEGLIRDDEILSDSEAVLDRTMPPLSTKHEALQQEATRLEKSANTIPEEDRAQLDEARESLSVINAECVEKRRLLEDLRRQAEEQDSTIEHLQESRSEFTAAIQEANRVREACRGVSIEEITALTASVRNLEEQSCWTITSASSNPSTLTMAYKSDVQLFFHPQAFDSVNTNNSPISLTYIGDSRAREKKPLTTTLRFFLQLLRASLQALPQASTNTKRLLELVSTGWDMALQLHETERRLSVETLTSSHIIGDERLDINAEVLLPQVRTKVRAAFEVEAEVEEIDGDGALGVNIEVVPKVTVVYGEQYNEQNMTQYLKQSIDGYEKWDEGVRLMREKLIARGPKGGQRK
ncbi:Putative Spc7 kinetochore protein [Septoria linicola]|uniref:Spc7 kinetochore protein n=1 Tax=Septoria linicola TaxID=215465 RepID=A0A9Q9EFU6_9PEZI|nr:Putative Spc7 kinetochore protein [Septoria linicola]